MKNSIMKNLIQYKLDTTAETQNAPMIKSLIPGGNFIIGIEAFTTLGDTTIRLIQDGKTIFPLRSELMSAIAVIDNWFYVPQSYYDAAAAGAAWGCTRITDLCIPIKPDVPLTLELSTAGSGGNVIVNVIVANEDDTTLMLSMLDKINTNISKFGGKSG